MNWNRRLADETPFTAKAQRARRAQRMQAMRLGNFSVLRALCVLRAFAVKNLLREDQCR
jgi:hypothetical protein